jgi:hypothetical protein
VIDLSRGMAKDRQHGMVVYIDGPAGRTFVLSGEAEENEWPSAKPVLESSFSTFDAGP